MCSLPQAWATWQPPSGVSRRSRTRNREYCNLRTLLAWSDSDGNTFLTSRHRARFARATLLIHSAGAAIGQIRSSAAGGSSLPSL